MIVLAIVGSTEPNNTRMAKYLIVMAINFFKPDLIVSGKAPGVDTLAERAAERFGIEFEGFPPKHKRWEPEGFKERNIKVAERCTHLFRIANKDSRTYGSGWTHDYAARIGKKVYHAYL